MTQQLRLPTSPSINTHSILIPPQTLEMTVGPVHNPSSQPDKRRIRMKRFTDFDSESGGSSEEFESPKSVWKTVHHQVLKIREEDSHLGEDIGEKLAFLKSNLDAFLRENHGFIWRGASPLSGKSAIKSFN